MTRQRSTFVSVVAWIFIALSGITLLISVLQNVMFRLFFDPDQVGRALDVATDSAAMPAAAALMFEYFGVILLGFLAFSLFTLAISIGLLLRRNWARIVFLGLLVFMIVGNLGGLLMSAGVSRSMVRSHPDQLPPAFEAMTWAIFTVNALITLLICGVLAWIIKRLMSPSVRMEFT